MQLCYFLPLGSQRGSLTLIPQITPQTVHLPLGQGFPEQMHTDSDGQEVELKFRTHCLEKCSFDLETSWKTEEETVFIRRHCPLRLSLPADFTASQLLVSGSPHFFQTGSESSFQGNAWLAGRLAGRLAAVCIL